MNNIQVLFLSDTHLGFDSPARPKTRRRLRGPDFMRNYHKALAPAFRAEVDMVVHGGDLFYSDKLPAGLVAQAFEPLMRLADRGIPVFIVPGNHEHSEIPFPMLTSHPLIHIMTEPRTVAITIENTRVAVSGFAYQRDIRDRFASLVEQTGWRDVEADIRLLCIHQCVEGAQVKNFQFGKTDDVVDPTEIPESFAACLSGHVHRFQVLNHDLEGNTLFTPVLYAGSTERTSFAEKDETKGFLMLNLLAGEEPGGNLTQWQFEPLPTRPMVCCDLAVDPCSELALKTRLWQALAKLPQDGVVQLRMLSPLDEHGRAACQTVRRLAPSTMNLDIRYAKAG